MSLLPIQAQSFLVYGNGVVIGNTSITLASFNDINGTAIPFQGTVMTGTLEPNNGTSEEQIIFTGITTNTNGTVTLTGVSSVGFASPYTLTTGVVKNHAGGVTFALADTAYLYSQYANLQSTQTFTGTNTFNVAPFIPTVTSSQTTQAASIGYVNSVSVGAGAVKASNTVFGISELTVAPATASVPLAVGDNDPRVPTASEALALIGDGGVPSNTNTYITQSGSQIGTEQFAIATGGSVAYAVSLTPTPTGYVKGERVYFQANVASGTSPTINKNTLGAKSLYKQISSGTTPLTIGDLGTNQMCVAEYDGGAYQLLSPTANTPTSTPKYSNGQTTRDTSTTSGTQTIAHGLGVIPKFIRFSAKVLVGAGSIAWSDGSYNGTTNSNSYAGSTGSPFTTVGGDTTNIINLQQGSAQGNVAVATFDATNITLTWTKTSTPSGTAYLEWEAQA